MRKLRSPRSLIVLRMAILCFVPTFCLACLAGWDWIFIGWTTGILVFLWVGSMWPIVTFGTWVFHYDDPHFLKAVRDGYRPFWDSLPTFLNPSSGGLEYIVYWCPICLAPMSGPFGHCNDCGYPKNGDCSAYFREYGDKPPAGVTNNDWTKWLSEYQDRRAG